MSKIEELTRENMALREELARLQEDLTQQARDLKRVKQERRDYSEIARDQRLLIAELRGEHRVPEEAPRPRLTRAQRVLARKMLRHQREHNEVLGMMKATGIEACVEYEDGELRRLEPSEHRLHFRVGGILQARVVDPSEYEGEPEASFPGGLEDVNYPPVYPDKPIR